MKKRKLLILGILSFILYSCSDVLETPQPVGQTVIEQFGISDARHYFEENATDLAPLRFKESVATKNPNQPVLELSPDWKRAMQSGHSGVSLIEVPISSNSVNVYTETVFKDGKKVLKKRFMSRRRLVIARRSTGETDMFVITIVPLVTASGNVYKSMENFRYLGGGDFTGRVFCSTLDGKFVKAFGYTIGRLNGTLVVMKRSELEKHKDEEWSQNYSSINLMEGVRTRASTYVFDEGGGSSGLCPHGYPENSCSICLDEVVVTGCRYCHMQNGCICDRCFYCGNKEPECWCTRCIRCGNKMPECTCYLYPDPNPDPNPHPGGGGGTIVNPPDPEENTPDPPVRETPPPLYSPTEYMDYYKKRIDDFKRRNPGKEPPKYYQYYGDFYMNEFLNKTRNVLSTDGKLWVDETLLELQKQMDKLLQKGNDIETDENFKSYAFDTHVQAYVKTGITNLSMQDKLFIFITVYPSDLFSVSGIKQVKDIMGEQIETYQKNPGFAWQQAQELMRNQEIFLDILGCYLLLKGSEDPRPKTKSVAVSEEQLFDLLFGEQVAYFKATFGDEFHLTE